MTVGTRTLSLLLASYYIVALSANTPDLKEIKSKIKVEIEVEKIKNKIVSQLRTKGAQVDFQRNGQRNSNPYSRDSDLTASRIITNTNDIPTHQPYDKNSRSNNVMSTPIVDTLPYPTGSPPEMKPKAKPIIVIGEPRSKSKKDKCLNFMFGKYMVTDTIVPIRMNLWIHLRVKRKGRTKNRDKSGADVGNDILGEEEKRSKSKKLAKDRVKRQTKKKNRKRKNKKKRKNRKKKNKKGRKVKIFVSDESKKLVIMRMRVKETNWYMLELPISQFPPIINSGYSRTLCIKCKRCNKKIKIDLRRPKERSLEEPKVPFIHIEQLQSLPHSIYRNNERRRRDAAHHQEQRVPSPCCREDIYTTNIAKDFPNVLHPSIINISLCTHLTRDDVILSRDYSVRPLLSQQNSSISNQVSWTSASRVQCKINAMKPLTLTFIDKDLKVRQTTVDHLVPTGCVCSYRRG